MSRGFKDRTGERRLMNCGLWAEIIAYRGCHDIDIKFENGDILYNKDYYNFTKGSILCDSYNVRLGEKRLMNCGKIAEIVVYRSSMDIDVRFEDGTIIKNRQYNDFLNGRILYKDKTHRKAHHRWKQMMDRCYNKNCNNYKYYGEKGVTVCKEWHNYDNFKKWYDEHIYELKDETVHLDKDILIENNKIYSPETCIFVPNKINQIFKNYETKRRDLPIGVIYNEDSKKYIVRMSINGKNKHIGSFKTKDEAYDCYLKKRRNTTIETIESYKDRIPKEVYIKLINIVK